MNIKKNIMKTMCAALACTTIISNLIPVYATEAIITESPMDESVGSGSDWTVTEENLENIEVTYQQTASYIVTIPKTIALGTNKQAVYSVKVTGDIDANERVHVVPVDGISGTEGVDFYMKDQTPDSKKADVVATVVQNKFYWNSEEVTNGYEETNNSVSAPDLTAGTWKGTFQVAINLETMAEHVHNYIDGKCDCGAIDPEHTHNYEDGKCTICGKETDLYETAPANEYSDWDYTLDDENDIITLNYYKGSKTDVIVYANYVIGEKTYKTQIASNVGSYTEKYMFNGTAQVSCKNIKSIIFSDKIDTSNVSNMNYMFRECQALIELNLSNFDTSSVTNMTQMFSNCGSLTQLDLSSFNTSNVTNMGAMFIKCKSLVSLNLSNFDTSSVTNMTQMFQDCNALANLDVSSFDTSGVTNMAQMFYNCPTLTELDLCSFDTGNVTKMGYMFGSCSNLKTIYVTRDMWSISKATTTDMFNSCGTSSVTYK